jgi:lysophospholipase L1-like esterase
MREAIRYLAFGDSLTVGYGAAPGLGFVPLYASSLSAAVGRDVQPNNVGVNGATTQNLLDSLRTDPGIRAGVKDADIITITAGGNDLLQAALPFVYEGDDNILKSALQAYEANYRGILETIREIKGDDTDLLIILVGLYNPLPLMTEASVWVRKFNDFLRQLAGSAVRVVDVYDVFIGRERELLYSDHIHPNAKGYAVIAGQIIGSVDVKLYQSIG